VTTARGALIGQWLGDYQLQALLGVGGMAEVYRARDAALGRDVAVKVLPLDLAADPAYVERFRKEAREIGALNHPNLVPVYLFDEQGPYLYLVMPLMKESLRDRLRRETPLPVVEAIEIMAQILSGLAVAHGHGVVHRDVKPENILLDGTGVAMLTDFGIARRVTVEHAGGPTLAGTGLPVGTPQYMSPEQLRGEDLDQRADIYSAAAVLYETLTGRPPHVADSPYRVASRVLTAPIVAPSQRNPEVWPELEQAILKALSRNRDDRFPTAASFAEALQEALVQRGIELIMPGRVVRMTPRHCGTCGARLTSEALAAGRCPVCDAATPEPLSVASDIRQAGAWPPVAPPANQPQERSAVWPPPQPLQVPREPSGGFLRALGLGLGAALAAALVAALLFVFLQRSFNITLAPFSSSNSSANSNSSAQSLSSAQATLTVTTTQGRAPTATARPSATAPTATTVPANLSVQPTSITLSTCVAAQTQFTVRNTGGATLSWSATASVTGYRLSPSSGTLNGGGQQVVTVSGILLSGTITVTAPGARQSPQQVSVTCQL